MSVVQKNMTSAPTSGGPVKPNDYTLVPPNESYRGKTYSEWICDWINWFFSVDPDEHNTGPVVFLKQIPALTKTNSDIKPALMHSEYGSWVYKSEPNVMIGLDKLEIFQDQAILFPLIMAYWAAYEPFDTEALLRQRVRSDIDNGDNPPRLDQITINGTDIELPVSSIRDYRIETPLFQLMVPDVEYGKSYKDYVEYPMPSGTFQAVGCGYFFLIKDLKPEKEYIIHAQAKGRTTEKGDYFAELLYQIEVHRSDERPSSPRPGVIPQRNANMILEKLQDQLDKKGIDEPTYDLLKDIVDKSREKTKTYMRRFYRGNP